MTYPKTILDGKKPCNRSRCPFTIPRKKYDNDCSYSQRKYCTRKCEVLDKDRNNRVKVGTNICQRKDCGKIIPRRATDSDTKYNTRVYCSVYCKDLAAWPVISCSVKANQDNLIQGIKNRTDPISLFLRTKYE